MTIIKENLNKQNSFEVAPIENKIAEEWIRIKHYSHNAPNIVYAFGLFQNQKLVGIVTFGVCNTPHNDMIAGNNFVGKVIELNRVVILDNAPLNCASYMISKTLKWLKEFSDYKIVISYADTNPVKNPQILHLGYIYQASNFLYTGISKGGKKKTLIGMHPRTVRKDINNQQKEIIQTSDKHRYIYFLGSKKEKRDFLNHLKYRLQKYPKCSFKPERYKTQNLGELQNKLF